MTRAHRQELNEDEYMLDVLNRLSDLSSTSEIEALLPDRWQPRTGRCDGIRQAMRAVETLREDDFKQVT